MTQNHNHSNTLVSSVLKSAFLMSQNHNHSNPFVSTVLKRNRVVMFIDMEGLNLKCHIIYVSRKRLFQGSLTPSEMAEK